MGSHKVEYSLHTQTEREYNNTQWLAQRNYIAGLNQHYPQPKGTTAISITSGESEQYDILLNVM